MFGIFTTLCSGFLRLSVRDFYDSRDCYVRDCYVRDCYVRENYVAPNFTFLEVLTTEKRDSAIRVNDSTLRLMLAQFNLFFLFYVSLVSTSKISTGESEFFRERWGARALTLAQFYLFLFLFFRG